MLDTSNPQDDGYEGLTIDRETRTSCFDRSVPLSRALQCWMEHIVLQQATRPIAEDITAVVPVYDTDPALLHYCLASLCNQTLAPAGIIVVDDCSQRSDTVEYLDRLARGAMFNVIRNDRNLSLGPAMNRALRECRTTYALKLDSDDAAAPTLVSCYVDRLAALGKVDVLGCNWTSFGSSRYTTNHPARVTRDYVLTQPGYWFINHSGVLLNRRSVLAVGGYRCLRGLAEDYDLWVRMMLRGYTRFFNVQESLVEYRDVSTGLHRNFRGYNRLMLMLLKTAMRLAPVF